MPDPARFSAAANRCSREDTGCPRRLLPIRPPAVSYPISKVVRRSAAAAKPHPLFKCQRCPNATWINDLKLKRADSREIDYGPDDELRAECAALHVRWIWPQHNVSDCEARIAAIRAERAAGDSGDR